MVCKKTKVAKNDSSSEQLRITHGEYGRRLRIWKGLGMVDSSSSSREQQKQRGDGGTGHVVCGGEKQRNDEFSGSIRGNLNK